ncbi:MAG: PAS domain-containing protein, partial [Candidatus Latescibacterota bacterium]
QAEEAVKQSEERYRGLFLSMQEGFLLAQVIYSDSGEPIDFRYLEINPALERITGINREQIIGKTAREIIPDLKDELIQQYAQVAMTGEPMHHEIYEAFLNQYHDNYLFSPAKNLVAVLSLDITDRKQAEEERERLLNEISVERSRLHAILDSLPAGVWITDATGKMIVVNDIAREIYSGMAPYAENIEEYQLYKAWWADTGERIAAREMPLARAIRGEVVKERIVDFERFDGTRGVQLVSAAPILDSDKKILGAVAIVLDITEHRRTDEALRESEATLEAFFAASPGILNIIDEEFRYVKTGTITPTYFGLTRQTIVGKLLKDLAPEFEREYGPMLKRVLEKGQPELYREVHGPVPGRPGEITYWRASYFPVPLPGGRRGVGIMGVEITDIKKAEKAFSESESKLRAFFAAMNDVILVLDSDGRYLEVPPTNPDLLYKPAPELIGKTLAEVFPAEQADFFLRHIRETLETRKPVTMEYILKIDNAENWFSASISPLTEKSVILVARDITKRKRAEEENQRLLATVQEERDRLSALLNSISDEIWYADAEKRLTLVNPAVIQEFGPNVGEQRDIEKIAASYEVYRPDGTVRPIDEAPPLRALRGEVVQEQVEIVRTPATGELRYRQVNAAPVRDASGAIIGSVSVVRDITESKQAEKRIAGLRREQEAFLRHEVKNLFAPIQLFAELTLDSDNLTVEQIHYLQRIVETSNRAEEYLESMRQLHEIETGKYPLKRVPKSLNAVIEKAIQNLEPQAHQYGVSIQFQSAAIEPLTALDPQLMPGVFTNLIKNAVEHVAGLTAPEDKTVIVNLTREQNWYIIRINNKGEPIHPDRVATFFDKFNVGPEKRGGTGLGTSYAWLVTKAHGGNITVRSNAEEGTTVTVVLPVE